MTPQQVVRRGTFMVNLPVLILLVVPTFLALHYLSGMGFIVCMALSWFSAWIWWSLMVPVWRNWAAQQDIDQKEIMQCAVRAGLIWKKGSIFEKTEIPLQNKRK